MGTLCHWAWKWAPNILLIVIALLPIRQVGTLDWLQVVRVTCTALGLGYLLRQRWRIEGGSTDAIAGAILALGYVSVALQFGGDKWPILGEWGMPIFSLLTFLVVALSISEFRISVPEIAATAVVGILVVALAVNGFETPKGDATSGIPWLAEATVGSSLLLWFAVTRTSSRSPAMHKGLAVGIVGSLSVVAVLGVSNIAAIPYYWLSCQRARTEAATEDAIDYARKGLAASRDLAMGNQERAFRFRLASIWSESGETKNAAKVLGFRDEFIDVIPADAWDGPEGGNLFYKTSCWKDVEFLPGRVEVQVYASGNEVEGEWPHMRVELDGQQLGDIWVTSTEPRPYTLPVNIQERSMKRLQISFLNDLYQTSPHKDRNLKVERVELHYRQIDWE